MTSSGSGGRHPLIDHQVLDPVVDGIRLGQYHLVLGAGASADCSNASGSLPVGRKLEQLLLAQLGEDPNSVVGLQRAYEAACETLGNDAVVEMLRNRFGSSKPSPWHSLITGLTWQCIWTFNIDDVIEYTYRRSTAPKQEANTFLWQERPVPLIGLTNEVPVVHLHGYVGDIQQRNDPQLVFSMREYVNALRQADRINWHTTFRHCFPTYPVIVVGARLNEEIDFEEIIRQGNLSAQYGYPSLVVLPHFTSFERSEFERWGLIPVECTGEEFFNRLVEAVEARTEIAGESDLFSTPYTERLFEMLPDDSTARTPGHDFYGGHEPMWEDILRNLDAHPRWLSTLLAEMATPAEMPAVQLLYVFCGAPFTGKSTALLRFARELQSLGWEPVVLGGWDRIDVEQTLQWFEARPRAMLIIDPLATDIADLAKLLRAAAKRGQRLLIAGCDRERHREHIRKTSPIHNLVGVNPPLFIDPSDSFWWAIVDKRRASARLGRLEGANRLNATHYFVEHGRDLFSALADLEDAPGFIDRGLQAFHVLSGPLQLAFATIAIIGRAGFPTPASVAADVAGMRVVDLMAELLPTGSLADWIAKDTRSPGLVRLKHPYLGEIIVQKRASMPGDTSLGDISMGICTALADRVNVGAIVNRTLEYRIVADLMDEHSVHALLGSRDVDHWYAELEPLYSWNARYWEQRALALVGSPERAYSYAKRAVSRHRDAFSLNTLGTVLMRRARDKDPTITERLREGYWREGLSALVESRELGRYRFEHPFVTFFFNTGLILEQKPAPAGTWALQIEQAFADWYTTAQREGLFEDVELGVLLRRFPESWRWAE